MKLRHLLWSIAVAGCIDSPQGTNNAPPEGGIDTTPDSTPVAAGCNAAAQPIHSYTRAAELEVLLIGKWRHCSGPLLIASSAAGMELVADHTYFKLATDNKGGFVRMVGFGNQGTWDTSQETDTSVQFNLQPTPNSGAGEYPMFEDNPRRMAFLEDTLDNLSLYVLEPQ
jgi:hypothetical protein